MAFNDNLPTANIERILLITVVKTRKSKIDSRGSIIPESDTGIVIVFHSLMTVTDYHFNPNTLTRFQARLFIPGFLSFGVKLIIDPNRKSRTQARLIMN